MTCDEQGGRQCKFQSIGNYDITSTLGHGSSGRVKLGTHQITGQKVAIKIISRSQLSSSLKLTRAVERELAVLQLLHHPNLIELYEVLQDLQNVYFVTEFIPGGELYHILTNKGRLSEDEAREIFGQIASALSWCHVRNICHRDLKPENILLDSERKNIKIADFGMATMQSANALLRTSCGSPHYASPEIIKGISYFGPAADVWSAGIILYTLLTGVLPFDNNHVGRLLAKIKTGRFRKIPDWVSSSAKDLIYRILVVDPNQRISSNDILLHPWMIPYASSTNTLTPISPMLSIRSFSVESNPWLDDQLKRPLIMNPDDLHGPIRETLKVLWRDLSNDQIVSALQDKSPNLQKLTYHLLQQRFKRQQTDFMERSTNSIEPKLDICHTPTSSYSNITKCDINVMVQINDDILSLSSSSGMLFDDDILDKNRPYPSTLSALSTIPNNTEFQPNGKTTPIKSNHPSLDLLYPLADLCLDEHIHSKIVSPKSTPSMHETIFSATAALTKTNASLNLLDKRLKQHLSLFSSRKWSRFLFRKYRHIPVVTSKKSRFMDFIYRIRSSLFKRFIDTDNNHQGTVRRQEFTIQCMAKSELSAAGKLHYILTDHFEGRLNGCMYPDGKILWSGEIGKGPIIAENNIRSSSKICFVCKIQIVSDSKSLYKLVFVIHREEAMLVSVLANQLLDALRLYESESQKVMKANKWIMRYSFHC